jgi:mRNA interferase MazF
MRRGELYLVKKPGSQDPKRQRVFVIASRQALIDTKFSTVICAPVYSQHDGLSTQVRIGTDEGLRRGSSVHCDDEIRWPTWRREGGRVERSIVEGSGIGGACKVATPVLRPRGNRALVEQRFLTGAARNGSHCGGWGFAKALNCVVLALIHPRCPSRKLACASRASFDSGRSNAYQ